MKHLRLFETETEFLAELANLINPYVALSLDINKIHYNKKTESSIPNNEIWYTTTDGQVFNMPDLSEMGLSYEYTLLSNTYENGKGVMVFDQTVEKIGSETIEGEGMYTLFGDLFGQGNNTLLSIELPNSVTSIGYFAFINCSSLTSIIIPNSVTNINGLAFQYCSSLTSIVIPDGVTLIGDSTFISCINLTSIVIPDGVTSIGDWTFASCTGLTSITIGNGVTSIGSDAFHGCSGLTSITIPDSVTSIGIQAFASCTGLTSITIGNSVTSIGDNAFSSCIGLIDINYGGTIEQWNTITKGDRWNNSVLATSVHCTDGDIAI